LLRTYCLWLRMLVNKTNIGFRDSQRILNVREEHQHGQKTSACLDSWPLLRTYQQRRKKAGQE
jgi:hypothetical protein